MIILFMGPPAGGKGTISEMASKYKNLPIVNVGQLLRNLSPESKYYKIVKEALDSGAMSPPNIVGQLLKEETSKEKYSEGYILDGWFRQKEDLVDFSPRVDKVIYLKVPYEVILDRLNSRRICELNGHTYSKKLNPPKVEGICDIDGSRLIKRTDDSEEVLRNRMAIFNTKTLEMIDHFRKMGNLYEIDASSNPEEIFEKVKIVLSQ